MALHGIASRLYGVVGYTITARLAGSYLARIAERKSSPKEVVDLAFSFSYKDPIADPIARALLRRSADIKIAPIQVYEEILQLAEMVYSLKPRRILEIGTARGGTLFIWCRLAAEDATIISIDLPGGPFGGGYPLWRGVLYKYFRKPGQKLHLVRGDSHDPGTLERVREILGGQELDFLFIDGDHTYEGVKRDFEMYSPLVRRGGVIAFHDIVPGPPENVGGVPMFWRETKHRYRHLEIVKDWHQGGCGIGVLFVD